ncbi:DNA gyrase inhibitor YacG [Neisseriaceae bacterium ESL0693]|nr:DNA gyrase inhibitor YacG [Neisseriaceae bacterium ESL0693]
MNTNTKIVPCPTCGQSVVWDTKNPYRPFCSERCKLIDLGAWASEDYNLPAQEDEPFSETGQQH